MNVADGNFSLYHHVRHTKGTLAMAADARIKSLKKITGLIGSTCLKVRQGRAEILPIIPHSLSLAMTWLQVHNLAFSTPGRKLQVSSYCLISILAENLLLTLHSNNFALHFTNLQQGQCN